MKPIRIAQIGMSEYIHGPQVFDTLVENPDFFEVVGYAEENEEWIKKRGDYEAYNGLKRYSVDELIQMCDALLIETDVWDLTETAQKCIDAGKHIHKRRKRE